MILFVLLGAVPGASTVVSGVLARMDADGDGQVSAQEYAPFDDRGSFGVIDQDKNGQITVEELATYLRLTDPARNPHPHPGGVAPVPPPGPPASRTRGRTAGLVAVVATGIALGIWRWRRP